MEQGHNSKELLRDYVRAKAKIAELELEHKNYKDEQRMAKLDLKKQVKETKNYLKTTTLYDY